VVSHFQIDIEKKWVGDKKSNATWIVRTFFAEKLVILEVFVNIITFPSTVPCAISVKSYLVYDFQNFVISV
jgi:hypothetical protein